MSLSAFSIKRPVTTVMVVLIVVILGIVSLTNLKQELMPEMDLGIAIVISTYDGAGPQEIETLVTKPLEDALSTVTNLKDITSTSSSGTSIIVLEFNDGTDMDNAALKMRENIDIYKRLLPSGVEPRVLQIDPNMMQTFTVGVSADMDIVKLKEIVDDKIVNRLEKLDGVGSVSDSGGKEREISIELYPDKLAGYGISATQVAGILSSENVNMVGGNLNQGELELQVRTTGEFQSVSEIENLPITTAKGLVIRLSDIAKVTDGYKKVTSYSMINSKEGIVLTISNQSTANTVEVSDRINAELERLRIDYPELDFTVIMDTSSFIRTSISNVWSTAFQATVLAVLVLLLFLGNFRSSAIIGVAIPVSLIATAALMYFANLTMNMITLNALVISVGMLVDNSIVVLESISRHLEEGKDPKTAALIGAQEVGSSVVGSTLTTVVVFVPVLFVTGIAGKMFGQLGLILSFSLISSLAVSLTFVPMACSKFLKPNDNLKHRLKFLDSIWMGWSRLFAKLESGYGKLLKFSITHKKTVILVFIAFVLATGSVIGFMGMEFTANMDQGYISISVSTPRGSQLEEISEVTDIVLNRIENIDVIEEISVSVGSGDGMASLFGSSANSSDITIKLIPKTERPDIDAVTEEIRTAIGEIVNAEVTVTSSGVSGGNTVSFSIYSDDLDTLSKTGDDMVQLISELPMIRNAENSLQKGYPQARVIIDRNKASSYGLQASSIASTVNMAINGKTVTKYKISGSEIDVVMRYLPERLEYLPDLENLSVITPAGASVPLYEVAEIVNEEGPASITKKNSRRYITVSADFIDSDLGTVTNEIRKVLDNYSFEGDSSYEFGGTYVTMMESFSALGIALILGFILVYMVIASQFESLAYPGTILFSIPIAWTAGLFGAFITGNSISIIAFIGLILLMGIVVNNGIVLVDYINLKRREGLSTVDAILYAGPVRLRPILMTTITTVIGLLPMLFSKGDGSEMQAPLGAVIAFGLSLSTFVTLVLIPVLYLILHNIRKKLNTDKIKM